MSDKTNIKSFQKAVEEHQDKPLTDFLKWCKKNGWTITLTPIQPPELIQLKEIKEYEADKM